ncbi:hypothetical protein CCACVL1_19456 [Corchorus capsularis]|uniref:threonine--tRNA ligase n=1 Tax=Corchorus capsularis TaxID=210143 RepID=A0A1R3HGT7_COCAP|nr:hypothetical protein CCACVL1_19456 [Corchorus capsularis]
MPSSSGYLNQVIDVLNQLLEKLRMAFSGSDHPYDINQIIDKRIRIFQEIQAEQKSQPLPHEPIRITLPDYNELVKEGTKWVSSPMDIAQGISESLAAKALISSVNGVLWDMNRPLEGDCELRIIPFDSVSDSDIVLDTLWRSSAHILAQGFYYDAFYGDLGLNGDHLEQIEREALRAVEVMSPNIYNMDLWKTSGHAANYKENMFVFELDFQLPERFNLEYLAEDGVTKKRPVMIHRAVLGSVERMFAILLEHYKGIWPFWLSPRQAIVISVKENSHDYAKKVQELIHEAGYYVDVDLTNRNLQSKIKEASLAQYSYILVVGGKESETNTVSVRVNRKDEGPRSMQDLLQHFKAETEAFR